MAEPVAASGSLQLQQQLSSGGRGRQTGGVRDAGRRAGGRDGPSRAGSVKGMKGASRRLGDG